MSARRFGGAFSPGGAGKTPVKSAAPGISGERIAAGALFVWPLPLLPAAIYAIARGAVVEAGIELAAFAILMAGAWLTREGVRARTAFEAREMAAAPLPRIVPGAIVTGLGVTLAAAFAWQLGLFAGIGMGLLASGAHAIAFGFDPIAAKGDASQIAHAARIAETLETAEERIATIRRTGRALDNRALRGRIDGLMDRVEAMIAKLREDPADIDRVRRYLTVYLKGAEDAARKYAASAKEPDQRREFEGLLDDLDQSFGRGIERMDRDDRLDLEVEIEVLRGRLAQERN